MRANNLFAKRKRKFQTTDPQQAQNYQLHPNILDQDFAVSRPKQSLGVGYNLYKDQNKADVFY